MSSQSPGIGSALPDMNANTSAMVLTNDGVMASWEVVTSLGLPPMGGNSGKYLTTNGTAASWAAVAGGVTTMAAVGSTPSANGASIATDTLTLQPADGTHPGVVTAVAQTFGGDKTFAANTIIGSAPLTLGTVGGITGFWGVSGTLAGVSGTNWTLAEYNDEAYLNSAGASAALVHFRIKGVDKATLSATQLDLTGLGNGGAIVLKDAGGTTRTVTIDGAGAWVIT